MNHLIFAFIFLTQPADPGWLHNLDSAKLIAQKEHKFILLNFSGSDWCIPCISLRKDVFESDAFSRFAAEKIVLVNADFPRNKKNQLPKEQVKINEALADKYNPGGNFPYTLLLDENGKKMRIWDGYFKYGPDAFIREIREVIGLQ
jgi:thioredoxin-related protein